MAIIHVLSRENHLVVQDNDAVSYVQFYKIDEEKVKRGDEIYLYNFSTESPYTKGVVLGTYEPSDRHLQGHIERKGRIGIVFHAEINSEQLKNISWPNGRAHGESYRVVLDGEEVVIIE